MGLASEILIQTPRERIHVTGESIKGTVRFILDKDTVYKKISLSLVQKGFCQWYEYEHSYVAHQHAQQIRRKVGNRFIFEGHEKNIITKIYLLNKHTDENTTVTAGSHEHAFEIPIPENAPPSMKTDIGEIKYHLVLKFKKRGIFRWNKNFKTKIKIYPSIDSSITEEPLYFALDKTLTKLFSSNKHEINIKAELDKGYLNPAGERKITFVATNNSNVTFSIRTELISKTKYKDDYMVKEILFDDPKTVREVIDCSTVETPSVPGNSVANMFNIIPVPPELCTVRHSKIVTREYKLKVTLRLPLPHINSSVDIPVFVGERFRSRDQEQGDLVVPMQRPPSYWESMSEDKSKE